MSLIKAKEHLITLRLEDRIMEFTVSSATVKEASNALGCTEGEIAKTLSFIVNDNAILILTAGDKKIDNSKFKSEFHAKAKMIPFEDVESRVGHAAGGVCPFGINENVRVYLDESLKNYDIVYPAAGSSSSAVKLTIEELERASCYQKWVDVCK